MYYMNELWCWLPAANKPNKEEEERSNTAFSDFRVKGNEHVSAA